MADRNGRFRGARFVSKRARRNRRADRSNGLKTFNAPPSMGHLRKGRVYHARVPFLEDPSRMKIRPVVFLRPVDRLTTEVLAAYSRFDRKARPESVAVEINRRRCHLWLRPLRIPLSDFVSETTEVIDPDCLGHLSRSNPEADTP